MSGIERTEIMGADQLISWLKVLGDGYVKPDLHAQQNANATGVVRDTKEYQPVIELVNKRLCKMAGIDCDDLKIFQAK